MTEVKSLGYKPLRNTVLIEKQNTTKGGILLPEGSSDAALSQEVVAIGDDVKTVKVGDKVIGTGAAILIKVTDKVTGEEKEYLQITEYSIIGLIESTHSAYSFGAPNSI